VSQYRHAPGKPKRGLSTTDVFYTATGGEERKLCTIEGQGHRAHARALCCSDELLRTLQVIADQLEYSLLPPSVQNRISTAIQNADTL